MQKTNFTVNFYEVLGIEPNATQQDIRKQYSVLISKYHPDKIDKFEFGLFELIQKAYETLGNDTKRQEYDFFIKNISGAKNNDHFSLKNQFDNFKELEINNLNLDQDQDLEKKRAYAQIEFNKAFASFDAKRNFDRLSMGEKLDTDIIANKMDNLILQREQDEIEFTQNNIFTKNESFDISKFNAAYDMYKDKDKDKDKDNKNLNSQLIAKPNISPYNTLIETAGYVSINSCDNLFQEDDTFDGNQMCSNINIGKINKLDKIKNINFSGYTLNHNKIDPQFERDLEQRLKDRENETQLLHRFEYNDFDNSKEDKSFQFSHEIGITENAIDWDNNNEELLSACKKLIEMEKTKTKRD